MKILILSGGSGTRLFPLSRENYPKQFLKINNKLSFFQQTILRYRQLITDLNDIFIITNKNYEMIVDNQLAEIFGQQRNSANILLEPSKRNTAPAIALAIKYLMEKDQIDKNSVLLISPSDHFIQPEDKFIEYMKFAESIAKKGYIVVFGITPSLPETGYGYIESDRNNIIEKISEKYCYKVKNFHEKPNLEIAKKYVEKTNFYWNSGIFMFSIFKILKEFQVHCPEIYNFIMNNNYESFLEKFIQMPDISFDYAIMEKTENACVIPMNIDWSDVGSWDSLYSLLKKDENGNVKMGNDIHIMNVKNSLISSHKRIIAIDIDDLIIVDTKDILLLVRKGSSQKIKEMLKNLKD